jgi:hypothetical protein
VNTSRRRAPGIAWAITAAVLYAAVGVGTSAPAGADGPRPGGTDAAAPGTDRASNDPGPRRHGRDKKRPDSAGTVAGDSTDDAASRPDDPCPWWPVPRPVPPPAPVIVRNNVHNSGFIGSMPAVPAVPVPQFGGGVEPRVDIGDTPAALPAVTTTAVAPAAGYPAAPGPVSRAVTSPPVTVPAAVVPPAQMRAPAAPPPPPQRSGAGAQPTAPTRLGLPDDLRDADLAKALSMALPGLAAMAGMTAIGGLLGYRQARAGYLVRAAGAGRFLQ